MQKCKIIENIMHLFHELKELTYTKDTWKYMEKNSDVREKELLLAIIN